MKGFAVLEKLPVGVIQVGVLAFIFPGKMTFVPDIGKAITAGILGGKGLEGEECAVGIEVGGGRMVDELAEIDEMGLVSGALFER